jgi:hypothetical protein
VDEGRIPVKALDTDSLTACLMRMERSTGTESVREVIVALTKILPYKKYQPLRRAFAVWISRVLLKRLKPQEPLPEVYDLEEVHAMLAESAVEWTEQWKMEGLREGLQKGLMEGRSAVLSRLLAKRFGPESVGSKEQERLRSADPEQLDLWAERILDAKTIDDVFDE